MQKLLRNATILLFYSTYQMKDCHLLLLATLAVATITSAADIREVYVSVRYEVASFKHLDSRLHRFWQSIHPKIHHSIISGD